LLGNLHGFDSNEVVPVDQMPELERFVLHRLVELDETVREAYDAFDFRYVFTHVFNFCTLELSALYFDIRKDNLYCDGENDLIRRSCQTVLDHLFACLTTWLAPILCFTTEESWRERYPDCESGVHLAQFPDVPAIWRNQALGEKWQLVRRLRRVVTGALEVDRRDKRIGSSLESAPVVYVQDPRYIEALDGLDLAEIVITSEASVVEGPSPAGAFTLEDVDQVAVVTGMARGEKCQRCWRILPDVRSVQGYSGICGRCAHVVGRLDAQK
jgi:isoleucyl-tRNA synthetase